LAKRIAERQAKKRAAADAAEEARRKVEEIAKTVPDRWATAVKELHDAITDANQVFSNSGEQRHFFRHQPQPQPGSGNFARLIVYHNDTAKSS
jgi:hypothetical protein